MKRKKATKKETKKPKEEINARILIRFVRVIKNRGSPISKKEIFHDGEFTITFFPQGNSSGGVIGMGIEKSRESGNYYVIDIDPITGKTKLKKEHE